MYLILEKTLGTDFIEPIALEKLVDVFYVYERGLMSVVSTISDCIDHLSTSTSPKSREFVLECPVLTYTDLKNHWVHNIVKTKMDRLFTLDRLTRLSMVFLIALTEEHSLLVKFGTLLDVARECIENALDSSALMKIIKRLSNWDIITTNAHLSPTMDLESQLEFRLAIEQPDSRFSDGFTFESNEEHHNVRQKALRMRHRVSAVDPPLFSCSVSPTSSGDSTDDHDMEEHDNEGGNDRHRSEL